MGKRAPHSSLTTWGRLESWPCTQPGRPPGAFHPPPHHPHPPSLPKKNCLQHPHPRHLHSVMLFPVSRPVQIHQLCLLHLPACAFVCLFLPCISSSAPPPGSICSVVLIFVFQKSTLRRASLRQETDRIALMCCCFTWRRFLWRPWDSGGGGGWRGLITLWFGKVSILACRGSKGSTYVYWKPAYFIL